MSDETKEEMIPPIPPNCSYFRMSLSLGLENKVEFACICEGLVVYLEIDHLLDSRDIYWRPLIACVASAHWAEELRRLMAVPAGEYDYKAGFHAAGCKNEWLKWGGIEK